MQKLRNKIRGEWAIILPNIYRNMKFIMVMRKKFAQKNILRLSKIACMPSIFHFKANIELQNTCCIYHVASRAATRRKTVKGRAMRTAPESRP